jgi:hypothetical protein
MVGRAILALRTKGPVKKDGDDDARYGLHPKRRTQN